MMMEAEWNLSQKTVEAGGPLCEPRLTHVNGNFLALASRQRAEPCRKLVGLSKFKYSNMARTGISVSSVFQFSYLQYSIEMMDRFLG